MSPKRVQTTTCTKSEPDPSSDAEVDAMSECEFPAKAATCLERDAELLLAAREDGFQFGARQVHIHIAPVSPAAVLYAVSCYLVKLSPTRREATGAVLRRC